MPWIEVGETDIYYLEAGSDQPLDHETLFPPIGHSLKDGFKAAKPRMHEGYLRIRPTATRLEAMRYPRIPGQGTTAERAAMAERVPAIHSPMLIVSRSLDRMRTASAYMHELVPHSKFEGIEGGPHNIYYECAEAYNAAVDSFLTRVLN